MPRKKSASGVEDLLEKGLVLKGSDKTFEYTRIPFGVPALDSITGGGIPRKKFTELYGNPSVGKSYLASQLIAQYQRTHSPDKVAWIDTELSWDAAWMARCGVNVDEIIVAQPATGETAFDIIKALLEDEFGCIVLDSIAGLIPSDVRDEDFGYNPISWQARFVNSSIARIMSSLSNGGALIGINQLRSGIGPVPDATPGGVAQEFFAHMRLRVRRNGWIEEGKVKIGFDMEVTNMKSKVDADYQAKCVIPFRFDGGIDLVETYIREALAQDIIIQKGAWYTLPNGDREQGMNGLRAYFTENQEAFENMKGMLE